MKRIANVPDELRSKPAYAFLLLYATTTIALPAQTFTRLDSFNVANGADPTVALVQAANGNLYVTTAAGGAKDLGTVFMITPGGKLTSLHSFDGTDGESPAGTLVQASNGDLYGTTFAGGAKYAGTVFKITPSGALTTLYSFCSQSECTDGSNPAAGLIQATDGNFYGTTWTGGANCEPGGCGTIFKITPTGELTTVFNFPGQAGSNSPSAALVQATDGDLYGETTSTIFKISTGGTLTTIYTGAAGFYPVGGLVQATDGNFYGTNSGSVEGFYGTVFKITPSGALTTLYSFCFQGGQCPDGYNPRAGLVEAANGDFFGTTYYGGANGDGTAFEITPSGALTTLYSFCGQSHCTDGKYPTAGLVQDTSGEIYGTTDYGGSHGHGTVFSLSLGLGPFVKTQPRLGKVGADVSVLGTNLTGTSSVTFNGTAAAAFTVISPSLISATVPAGATTGTVQVVTPSGTLSSNVPFQVLP